jgi:hypothetical protein
MGVAVTIELPQASATVGAIAAPKIASVIGCFALLYRDMEDL